MGKLVECCDEENVNFMAMSEEERDWFLAEWALEDYEAGESRSFHAELLSALAKSNPRVRYKVSYRVLDAWSVRQPPKQAPALPHEVLTMMFMLLVATGRPGMGCGAMLCYSGLLRAREMLTLRRKDLVMCEAGVVLCLGITKRGREQKVICSHPAVAQWVCFWLARRGPLGDNDRVFDFGYTSFLKWLR